MPTLRQFSYLVALEEELHFRRAAEKVHVTQPTLSAQLQQLEKRLGAGLIERGGSQVMLTPLGREVAARARLILREVEEIKTRAASSQHGFTGTVRIGVPPTLGPYLLPHIVPDLHSTYPQLKLYVRESKPADLQSRLLSGEYDLIVSPLPVVQADLTVQRLFREPLQVVTAPDHPLVGRKDIGRVDLRNEAVLAIEPGHHQHEQVSHICDDFGARLLRDYEGTSLDTLRLMVGMGVGIAFLPSLYVRSEIGARGEVAVLDLNANVYRQVGIAWRNRSVHTKLFNDISELIRKIAAERLPEVSVIAD